MMTERSVLLLLHGLGGNGRLWDGLVPLCPGFEIVAPDLAGHGSGPRLPRYEVSDHVEDLAGSLHQRLTGRHVVVAAHSLGAIIAVDLVPQIARRGAVVQRSVLFSIKTTWPPDDLAALQRPVQRQPQSFPNRAAAAERFVRVVGLTGLLEASHPAVEHALHSTDRGWELAADPATHAITLPPVEFRRRIRALPCDVTLARGTHDQFATLADMDSLGHPLVALTGCGHNPHVEAPRTIAGLFSPCT